MSERLNVKDLITVGIFAVILIVLIFAFGMLGYIPILMLALPILAAPICGIPYMLFLTRVSKFGMVTLLGVNDDYSNVSFSDKFVDWVTVVARK